MKDYIIYFLGTVLILGGVYTFYTSTSQLFGWFTNPPKDVVYIRLTQVCCLICSFLYLISGALFFIRSKISTTFLFIATIIMFVGYIAMLFHINSGKPITMGFVGEMLLRTTSTMLFAAVAWYLFTRIRFVYPPGHNAESFKKLVKEYELKKGKSKL